MLSFSSLFSFPKGFSLDSLRRELLVEKLARVIVLNKNSRVVTLTSKNWRFRISSLIRKENMFTNLIHDLIEANYHQNSGLELCKLTLVQKIISLCDPKLIKCRYNHSRTMKLVCKAWRLTAAYFLIASKIPNLE